MAKRIFKFTVKGAGPYTDIEQFKDDAELYALLSLKQEQFYTSQAIVERKWRNQELGATDFFMLSDATYGGKALEGSTELQDILNYRTSLRNYDLTYQTRPARPEWFK